MRSSRTYHLLLAVLIVAGGSAGYLLGKPKDGRKITTASIASNATHASGLKDASNDASSKEAALSVMAKLKADDPTGRDTGKQIAAWEKIRGFTVEECLAALDADGEKATPTTQNEAAFMLYFRLAELDPHLALKRAGGLASPLDGHFMRPIFAAWFRKDPEAAYSEASKLPDSLRENLRITEMMYSTLLSMPPDEMMKRAEGKDPEVRQNLIAAMAELSARDPAQRDAFLKRLEGYGGDERYYGMRTLLRTWATEDPAAVLENWDSYQFQDRPGQGTTRDEIIGRWAFKNAPEALGWMDTHPDKVQFSQQVDAFRRWTDRDRAAADQWLEGRAEPQAIAAEMVKQKHANLLRSGHMYGEQYKEKHFDQARGYYRVWSKADPDGAAQWLSGIDAASAASIKGNADESR